MKNKSFLERAQRHLIPCTVGAFIAGFVIEASIGPIIFGMLISIVLATLISTQLGLDKDEEV